MQYKILSLTILNLSAYIGKQQKKMDKIHEQVSLKKLIFSYQYSQGRAVNRFAVQYSKYPMPETYTME